ncbi:MAG: 2-dehydropantoate 2-reductase N-terminal domain-containing protein, partial [Sandaracinobacteroides sp.]
MQADTRDMLGEAMVTERPEIAASPKSASRIAIFGAGMIGLYIGGLLARHADVMFIGRASMLAPLADGLRLTDTDGLDLSLSSDQFATATDPAALADCKLVLVTVKSMATPEAAAAIAAYAPADALVISFQNGVSNPETLRLAAGTRTVLAGMVPFNIAQLGP